MILRVATTEAACTNGFAALARLRSTMFEGVALPPLAFVHTCATRLVTCRDGQPIAKSAKGRDMLDTLLRRNDAPGAALRTLHDPYNDEELTLSREELRVLLSIQRGRLPSVSIDPYEDLVDWYSNTPEAAPAAAAPEPKRRFAPSKWEEKKIIKLVSSLVCCVTIM